MKKIYFIIAVLCIASLFASCNQEQSPDVIGFGDEVEVEMNIIATSQSQTRAAIDAEKMIENLTVLVFDTKDAATEGDAKFLYYRHAWFNDNTKSYRAVLKTGSNLKIYLAANVNDLIIAAGLDDDDVYTYEMVRNKLILTNPQDLKCNKLPMWGIVPGKITIEESDDFIQLGEKDPIYLLRSVASADLEITDASFGFLSAGIVRATNLGFLTHEVNNVELVHDAVLDKDVLRIIAPKVPSRVDLSYSFGDDYSWKKTPTFGQIVNEFYMFENDAPENGKLYTKLIVEGKYKNEGEITYYPLAFRNDNNEKVQVARNRKFEITVKNVYGPGYPTVKEAIDTEDVNMGYEVVIWDNGYRDSDIIVDGPHYVSFSGDKKILLANESGSDALRWFSTNALEMNGSTPTNLVWSFDNFATQVKTSTISNKRFKVDLVKESPDPVDESYYLRVTTLADYKGSVTEFGNRTATLSIRMGRIQFEITLEQVQNAWADGGNQNENL